MDRNDRLGYRADAQRSLTEASYDHKKLILLHTGAILLLSVTVNIIGFLLGERIEESGGLGGLGVRGILTTVRTVLNLLPLAALPFWQMGYVYTTVQIARKKPVGPETLLEGFRKFFPVLRLKLLMAVLYMLVMFLTTQVGTMVFVMTPWATPMMSAIFAYTENPEDPSLMAALDAAAADAAVPMLVIMGVIFLALAAPFFYRFRFAERFLMERPLKGALGAMKASSQLTAGMRMGLFRMDLSFWWFYLLAGVSALLAYADMILPWLGVQLPFSEGVNYFLCLVLYAASQLALHWWRKNEVAVTYAQVYTDLQNPPPEYTKEPEKRYWD